MRDLRDRFNETVNLRGARPSIEVVYLEITESRRSLRMQAQLGRRDPIYSTALGKAVLAFKPEDPVACTRTGDAGTRTEHTLTSLGRLRQDLAQVRERRFAFGDEEDKEGARFHRRADREPRRPGHGSRQPGLAGRPMPDRLLLPKAAAAVKATAAAIFRAARGCIRTTSRKFIACRRLPAANRPVYSASCVVRRCRGTQRSCHLQHCQPATC
ncbi:MAG: IclR family transcriptional regulator C-terminal domain-containing protein [Kouleothrix sp.]